MAKQTNKELFLYGIVKVLKEQQFDVQLMAKDSSATIPAHKLFLCARSEVFKKMFESDQCKASSRLETVTFSELKYDELEAFVEFIYSNGSSLSEKAKKHVISLYCAADKYEIPHLRDVCREELISCLSFSNALDVYELAQIPLDIALKKTVLVRLCRNLAKIAKSDEFKRFVAINPNLTVEIVNAYITWRDNNGQ